MRPIDADVLYKTIDQEADFYGGFGDNVITASELRRCIEMVPTIDAVPVVRCRDCKWGKMTSKEGIFYHCGYPYEQTGKIHLPDWYCPGGARKEDAK